MGNETKTPAPDLSGAGVSYVRLRGFSLNTRRGRMLLLPVCEIRRFAYREFSRKKGVEYKQIEWVGLSFYRCCERLLSF